MTYYAKLIAAVVGLAILVLKNWGLDLEGNAELITDALVAIVTAIAVYKVRNRPATGTQMAEALQTAQEKSVVSEKKAE